MYPRVLKVRKAVMSDNSEEIAALRAKVKQLQEQLSKIGQPKRPSAWRPSSSSGIGG